MRGNFDTPPILVQGHRTRETLTPPTLGSLWTISCMKLWPVKLTLYRLGPPPDELLKHSVSGQHFHCSAKGTDTEDAQRAGRAPNCAKKILWGEFRHQTEKRIFPTNLSPDEVCHPPPPPCMASSSHTPRDSKGQITGIPAQQVDTQRVCAILGPGGPLGGRKMGMSLYSSSTK